MRLVHAEVLESMGLQGLDPPADAGSAAGEAWSGRKGSHNAPDVFRVRIHNYRRLRVYVTYHNMTSKEKNELIEKVLKKYELYKLSNSRIRRILKDPFNTLPYFVMQYLAYFYPFKVRPTSI